MTKGHQIVEPKVLAALAAMPTSHDFLVALLSWIVEVPRIELRSQLGAAELDVIGAEYFGAFPALGIRYDRDDREDLGGLVDEAVTRLVRERSLTDFISYLEKAKVDWRRTTDTLVGPVS